MIYAITSVSWRQKEKNPMIFGDSVHIMEHKEK